VVVDFRGGESKELMLSSVLSDPVTSKRVKWTTKWTPVLKLGLVMGFKMTL
jgi:hypothetical protein